MRVIEIWEDIIGYEGKYLVSNMGNVISVNYNNGKKIKELTKTTCKKGYENVALYNNGKRKYFKVHRLVAQAFIPNTNNLPCINHIDENKKNNFVENLEWCDIRYNNNYGNRLKKIMKPINQYDMNGKLIMSYESAADAARKLDKTAGNISECCKNKRKSAYGFKWQYQEVD